MGFEMGKGLGKNKQGITTPVEAVKRKGKATIGYYGPERTERSLKDFPVQDKDEEEEKEFQEQMSQWRKEPKVKSAVSQENLSPGFHTRSDTNQAVQSLKMVRGLKFQIKEGEGLYYICSENKGAD